MRHTRKCSCTGAPRLLACHKQTMQGFTNIIRSMPAYELITNSHSRAGATSKSCSMACQRSDWQLHHADGPFPLPKFALTLFLRSAAASAPGTRRVRFWGSRRGAPDRRLGLQGPGRSSTRPPGPPACAWGQHIACHVSQVASVVELVFVSGLGLTESRKSC